MVVGQGSGHRNFRGSGTRSPRTSPTASRSRRKGDANESAMFCQMLIRLSSRSSALSGKSTDKMSSKQATSFNRRIHPRNKSRQLEGQRKFGDVNGNDWLGRITRSMSDTVLGVPAASLNLIARQPDHYFLRGDTSFRNRGSACPRDYAFGAQENPFLDGRSCTCVLSPCGSKGPIRPKFQGALLFLH